MKRVCEERAYGNDPITSFFWQASGPQTHFAPLNQNIRCDVAVIGAGFTGISAAYHLAQKGVCAVLLDAQQPLFGATGRNGGFCCLGGGLITDHQLDRQSGKQERLIYRQSERAAVNLVYSLINDLAIDADTHSKGKLSSRTDPRMPLDCKKK
jgi:glycine/D-amino acid oxidase-like deaminating enzyme